ncbi:MAG: Rieske (2Fe-2S) protein [Pseudonocardiaceae bacterium]
MTDDIGSDDPRAGSELTRRAVVAGSGILAVSAALAACSSYGDQGTPPASEAPAAPAGPADTSAAGAPAPSSAPNAPTGERLAATSAIPVGGGMVFADKEVVVTQPAAGEFKAFSATCTHQGCTVNKVAGGTIDCPCHGSKFAIADGSVAHGPAQRPLAARQVTVSGGELLLES